MMGEGIGSEIVTTHGTARPLDAAGYPFSCICLYILR